ncbi:acyl-CoA thioesterase [Granulicatella seriolae]|uniref:Acyl-CoA thioesterase n=1 Tax=Granulicatella seriolae TaxID=2967226 RepID=A0ABT1WNS7_9LACT|nr:acyl-CoA thioesterase [Granulicatella seriolae]
MTDEQLQNHIKTCKESRAIQSHRIFPFDTNMHNTLFGGNLTRLIDDCASISVSRHCRRHAVTASIDAMNYLRPLPMGHSVCIETYASGVGKTSVEIFCKIIGEDVMTGERYLAATSFWTFVALPNKEEYDFTLDAVVGETAEETFICSGYQERRQKRLEQLRSQETLSKYLTVEKPWIQMD